MLSCSTRFDKEIRNTYVLLKCFKLNIHRSKLDRFAVKYISLDKILRFHTDKTDLLVCMQYVHSPRSYNHIDGRSRVSMKVKFLARVLFQD